jgi:nucleolar MIF4G domain-containing protein 1
VQTLVIEYERYYKLHQAEYAIPNAESVGKEASGLISLFSELYNFHVIGSELVFDIIRNLLQDELQELNVELLLKLLRSA